MSHYQGGGAVVGQIPPGQQQQAQAVHHQQQQQQQQLHYQGQPQPHAVHMQQGVYPHQMVPQQAPPQPQQQQQHHAHHQQVQQYQPQPQSQPQQQQQQAVSRVHPQQAHQAQAQVQQQQPPSSQQQQQQHQQAAQQAVAQQRQQIAGGGIQEMPARIGQHLESIRGEFDRLLGEYQATASQRARGGAGSGAIDSDLEQKLVQQINELGGVQAAVNVIGRRVDEAQRDYNLTVAQYQLQNLEKVAPNLSAIIMNAQPPDLSNVSMDIYQSVVPNGPSTGPPTQEQLKQQQQQQWSSYNQNYLQAHGTPAPPIGHQQGPNQLGYQQMQQHYRAIQHQQAQMQQQQQQQPQQTPVIGQQQPQQRIHPQMQQAPLQQQQQPQQQGMQPQQQPFMQQGQAPSQYGQQQRQPTPRQSQQIAVPPQQQQPQQQQGRGPIGGQSQQMQYGAAAPQPGMEPNGVQGGSEQVGSIRPGRAGSRGNAMNISMSLADYDVTQLSSSHYREHGDWHVIYNPTKGEPVVEIEHMHTLVHNGVVCCVKFSKDGKLMAAGSNRMAMLYEVPSFHLLREITEPFTWNNHPDGNINNNNDNNDPNIGNQAADLYVRAVCFSPDSKLLATGSEDRLVRIIEVATGNVLRVMQGHTSDIYALDFSTDGRLLLSGSGDCTAMVWDVNSGTRLHVLHVQSSPQDEQDCGVPSVAFSRDGYLVAAASLDKIIRLWNLSIQHNPVIERIAGHNDSVYSIAFAHHGNTLVSGSLDKTIKLWDLTALLRNQYDPSNGNNAMRQQGSMHPATIGGASLLGTLLGHKDFVLSVEFTFDDKYIISGSKDRTVQIWDSSTHEALALLSGHKDSVIGIGLNPAQPMFATASGDCKMKIWTYQSSSSSNAAKDVKPNINPTPAPPPQQQQQQQQQQ
ncbi:WD40 repeat-like protein [Ramicandelaber brevisporus]|nr:WD40 repeat-like protein [Ramicandelaber brevisporus]